MEHQCLPLVADALDTRLESTQRAVGLGYRAASVGDIRVLGQAEDHRDCAQSSARGPRSSGPSARVRFSACSPSEMS